jgi:hypothetical protein
MIDMRNDRDVPDVIPIVHLGTNYLEVFAVFPAGRWRAAAALDSSSEKLRVN